jgi:pimeloyl-ACP methyl ester carboxylesterase
MQITVLGRSAYVYTAGRPLDAKLPTVVFIHGGEQDHSTWTLQSRYFAYHGRNVLVPDLPGHGRSAGPALGAIANIAAWVAGMLAMAGIESAAVVGHSMGSLVALEFAARNPHRVTRLALLGTSAPMPVAQPLLDAAKTNDHAALEMINAWSHGSRAQLGSNPAPGFWMPGMNMRLMERQAPDVLYADFNACNNYVPDAAAVAVIMCPVLLVAGSRDQMTPLRAAHAAKEMLPRARLLVLEGAGHALMAEQPDAVLDALIDFL